MEVIMRIISLPGAILLLLGYFLDSRLLLNLNIRTRHREKFTDPILIASLYFLGAILLAIYAVFRFEKLWVFCILQTFWVIIAFSSGWKAVKKRVGAEFEFSCTICEKKWRRVVWRIRWDKLFKNNNRCVKCHGGEIEVRLIL